MAMANARWHLGVVQQLELDALFPQGPLRANDPLGDRAFVREKGPGDLSGRESESDTERKRELSGPGNAGWQQRKISRNSSSISIVGCSTSKWRSARGSTLLSRRRASIA